jgi:hypothetical protein
MISPAFWGVSVRNHAHTPKCILLHPEGCRGRQANIRESIPQKNAPEKIFGAFLIPGRFSENKPLIKQDHWIHLRWRFPINLVFPAQDALLLCPSPVTKPAPSGNIGQIRQRFLKRGVNFGFEKRVVFLGVVVESHGHFPELFLFSG